MGYPLRLDEISTENLQSELNRRKQAWYDGNCSYCGKPLGSSVKAVRVCRFHEYGVLQWNGTLVKRLP